MLCNISRWGYFSINFAKINNLKANSDGAVGKTNIPNNLQFQTFMVYITFSTFLGGGVFKKSYTTITKTIPGITDIRIYEYKTKLIVREPCIE